MQWPGCHTFCLRLVIYPSAKYIHICITKSYYISMVYIHTYISISISISTHIYVYISVQRKHNSSALAMVLRRSRTDPSIAQRVLSIWTKPGVTEWQGHTCSFLLDTKPLWHWRKWKSRPTSKRDPRPRYRPTGKCPLYRYEATGQLLHSDIGSNGM